MRRLKIDELPQLNNILVCHKSICRNVAR
ncbi:MAG: hypothetical protein PUF39_02490 [Prevotellaceae bacterium]|nr:hypothetical protein [Prevotellaceae bacterium]